MPKTLSRRRVTYDREFKLKVVREALKRPVGRRIRPTCSNYPSVEPCQLRKWIRALQYEAERGDRGSSCDSEPEDDSLPPLHAGVSFEAALPPDVEERARKEGLSPTDVALREQAEADAWTAAAHARFAAVQMEQAMTAGGGLAPPPPPHLPPSAQFLCPPLPSSFVGASPAALAGGCTPQMWVALAAAHAALGGGGGAPADAALAAAAAPPPPPAAATADDERPLPALPPLPASAQASDAPTVSPPSPSATITPPTNRSPISPNPDEEKRRAPESPARRALDVDERADALPSPLREFPPALSAQPTCSNLAALAPPAGCELESAVDGVGDQFLLDIFKNMVGSALDADHLETLLA